MRNSFPRTGSKSHVGWQIHLLEKVKALSYPLARPIAPRVSHEALCIDQVGGSLSWTYTCAARPDLNLWSLDQASSS